MATPKRLRQQLATNGSESDGREPQARVGSTYLLRLCDALPCLRGLCFSKCIRKQIASNHIQPHTKTDLITNVDAGYSGYHSGKPPHRSKNFFTTGSAAR